MNVFFVGILLWIPFLLVLITALILFLISGYRRGLWRSLISLGVTAVSAGLSVLLSKLIAAPIAGLITPMIPLGEMELPLSVGFLQELMQGLIGVIISLLLFSSLLMMFCLIGKTLSNHLGDNKLQAKNTGMKWAGLGIRLVDAVLFSLLLVLPLYGTLATYTPVVRTVIAVSDEAEDVQEFMAAVEEHPVVAASQEGPVAWVYDEMANAQVGDSALDIAGMARSVEGLITRVEALNDADEETAIPMTLELIDYLRTDVVDEEWCYNLVIQQLLPEFKESMLEELRGEDAAAERLFELCDMSRRDFRRNAHGILDFAEYLLESGKTNVTQEEAISSEEFLKEFGKLINMTDQAVGVKNLAIQTVAAEALYGGDLEEAIAKLPLQDKPVGEDAYVQDAMALLTILSASDLETFRDGITMLPGE